MSRSVLRRGTKFHGGGRTFVIKRYLNAGAQGAVYVVEDTATNEELVAKVYYESAPDVGLVQRIKVSIEFRLSEKHPAFCGPVHMITHGKQVGHVSPFFDGRPIHEIFPELDLMASLQLGAVISHGFHVLHTECGVTHGDIHTDNILVKSRGDAWHFGLIDFDNYTTANMRAAPAMGGLYHMAPEIRSGNSQPNFRTDCYSLAVLQHQLLLKRHVADGFASVEEFRKVMLAGRWRFDPSHGTHETGSGHSPLMLNSNFWRLFRLGLSNAPGERPTAAEWRDASLQALTEINVCPACHGGSLIERFERQCPHCKTPYPVLELRGEFGVVRLETATTKITREMLGASRHVSKLHAIIRREGPEYRIEDRSANGTYRLGPSDWIRLRENTDSRLHPLISPGDRLRFGDVECTVAAESIVHGYER